MSALPDDSKKDGAPAQESAAKRGDNYVIKVPQAQRTAQELSSEQKRDVADSLFPIEWESSEEGFMQCPGINKHTGENGKRDCKAYLGGGKPPTISCFHDSCAEEVAVANQSLRSALGKARVNSGAKLLRGSAPDIKQGGVAPLPKIPLEPQGLPRPLPNPMRTHVEACFKPGEYVSYQATDESGKKPALPSSYTMERDKLASAAQEHLNPNGYGLYIRVNPMQPSGSKAEEVAEYRHTLIENDKAPIELQWAVAIASELPISSVVHSGGKSLHLSVKVDAKGDFTEYNRRRALAKQALERFEGYEADNKTKDPARLTRLAGGVRLGEVQTLHAVKIGAPSWEEWEASYKAKFEAQATDGGQAEQPEDTEQSGELSSVYFMKEGGKFLWRQPTGQTVFANEDTVKRVYLNEINGGAGKAELSQFLYRIQTGQALDYAGSMPGYCEGIHRENGQFFYCMEAPVMPKSVAPEGAAFGEKWPVIHELMRRLFVNDDGETQFRTVLAHLKMGHQVLRRALEPLKPGSRRSVQPGQAMALIGPKNCGKSFFLEQVITPLLGGRRLDAFKAFTADAEGFNGEMLKGEVWMIDDQEHSTDIRTRRKFAANLKSKLFGAGMSFHAKFATPITLTPFGRLFICCNDTPENLSVLPPITEDISDKVHMILCNKTEMPMPTGTEAEREAFRDVIAREIPHFAGDLEAWTIPEAIAHQRTGVLTYFHPWVEAQLRKQAPEAQLVELILSAFEEGTLHGNEWEGTARELKDLLTRDSAKCTRDARSLLSNWFAATGTYLSRLAASQADYEKDYGLRVTSLGQRKGVERYGLSKRSS